MEGWRPVRCRMREGGIQSGVWKVGWGPVKGRIWRVGVQFRCRMRERGRMGEGDAQIGLG